MPLWGAFLLSFVLITLAAGGSLYYFVTSVLMQVTTGDTYAIAAGRALFLVIVLLVLLALLFIVLGAMIAAPLRRLSRAIAIFAQTGERTPIPVSKGAPKEIRELVEVFAKMSANVEAAHKRDQEVSRVKSDFISTAAHQLRTPLTGIRWAMEALEADNPTENQKALIASATNKSKELVAIVGTLLDISSIESGKYKYKFAQVDMPDVVEEVAKDFDPLASQRQLQLIMVPLETAIPSVRADRERIKWVLSNLVENALRYTPAGGSVQLSVQAAAGQVFVRVRDTGIGILPKDRNNIFERFFRGANAVSNDNEGNGLGLYIARTIATDHGGDLTFEDNNEGPGTTFILSLPV